MLNIVTFSLANIYRVTGIVILIVGIIIGVAYSNIWGISIALFGFLFSGLGGLMGIFLQEKNKRSTKSIPALLAFLIAVIIGFRHMLDTTMIISHWFLYSPFIIVITSYLLIVIIRRINVGD